MLDLSRGDGGPRPRVVILQRPARAFPRGGGAVTGLPEQEGIGPKASTALAIFTNLPSTRTIPKNTSRYRM